MRAEALLRRKDVSVRHCAMQHREQIAALQHEPGRAHAWPDLTRQHGSGNGAAFATMPLSAGAAASKRQQRRRRPDGSALKSNLGRVHRDERAPGISRSGSVRARRHDDRRRLGGRRGLDDHRGLRNGGRRGRADATRKSQGGQDSKGQGTRRFQSHRMCSRIRFRKRHDRHSHRNAWRHHWLRRYRTPPVADIATDSAAAAFVFGPWRS